MIVSSERRPEATEVLQTWVEESQHFADDPEPQTLPLAPAQAARSPRQLRGVFSHLVQRSARSVYKHQVVGCPRQGPTDGVWHSSQRAAADLTV